MSENKNPFLEEEKSEPTKIGFDSATPIQKGKKMSEKYPDNFEGKGLRRAAKLCTIFGIIFSVLSMMYFLLPIFAAIIGGLIAVILIFGMIFSVIITLGLILMNEGYRQWIGNNMMDIPNFFFNIGENVAKLAPYYLVVAIPALVLNIAGLVLGIVGQAKKYRFCISYIVLNSIFLTFTLFFTALYFIGGMNVFNV